MRLAPHRTVPVRQPAVFENEMSTQYYSISTELNVTCCAIMFVATVTALVPTVAKPVTQHALAIVTPETLWFTFKSRGFVYPYICM